VSRLAYGEPVNLSVTVVSDDASCDWFVVIKKGFVVLLIGVH